MDPSEYIFTLTSILNDNECRKCFRLFLKKEHNEEPLEFLDRLLDLEQLEQQQLQLQNESNNDDKIVSLVRELISQYIEANSPKQINLSSKDRTDLQQLASQWTTLLTQQQQQQHNKQESSLIPPRDLSQEEREQVLIQEAPKDDVEKQGHVLGSQLFKNVRIVVETEMMCDVLPRFLRSNLWNSLLQKSAQHVLGSVGRHRKAMEMSYCDADFMDHVVEDRDLFFLWKLSEDNCDWKLVGWNKRRRILAFSSHRIRQYFPDVSWMRDGSVSKFMGILPFSFEMCEHYMFHSKYMQMFDENVVNQRTVAYYSNEELREKYPDKRVSEGRSSAIVIYDVKFPFPLAPRVYCVAVSGYFDKEAGEGVLIYKPCHHPELDKVNKKKVCFFKDYQLYLVKKLDEKRTMYFQIHVCDVGSKLGNKLIKLVVSQRSKQLSDSIYKFLKAREHLPIPEHDLTDGVMRSYLDHKNYVLSSKRVQTDASSESSSDGEAGVSFGPVFGRA